MRTLSPTVDPRNRTGTAKISVDPGGPGRLVAGMFAEVQVMTAERSGVLLIPKTALLQRDGQSFVFVIENDQAHRRDVSIGATTGDGRVEIRSGLFDGEQVALNPIVLHDGDRVSIYQGG